MIGYLRHLANFAYVVDAGSMTAAARKLDASPSAMSESVKILEEYFREPLLERGKGGVTPTGRGLTLYTECRDIVSSMEASLDLGKTGLQGTVKLSAPSEMLGHAFVPAIERITREAPDIRLVLATENDVLDHTKFGRDLYIRAGSSEARPGLTTLHQGADRAVLVAHPDLVAGIDRADPKALEALPFLGSIKATSEGTLRLTHPTQQLRFERTLQAGSIDLRISLLRSGVGVAACLRSTVAEDIAAGRLVRLMAERFDYPVACVIASPHRMPSEAVRFVAACFAECLPVAQ